MSMYPDTCPEIEIVFEKYVLIEKIKATTHKFIHGSAFYANLEDIHLFVCLRGIVFVQLHQSNPYGTTCISRISILRNVNKDEAVKVEQTKRYCRYYAEDGITSLFALGTLSYSGNSMYFIDENMVMNFLHLDTGQMVSDKRTRWGQLHLGLNALKRAKKKSYERIEIFGFNVPQKKDAYWKNSHKSIVYVNIGDLLKH